MKTDPRIVKIKRWAEIANQHCIWTTSKKKWSIPALHLLAKELPVQEMPLSALNIEGAGPSIDGSMIDFVGHMKMVVEADLSFPIILDDEGDIMDGRHRIAKALLNEESTIKFVRFPETPPPNFQGDDDSDSSNGKQEVIA